MHRPEDVIHKHSRVALGIFASVEADQNLTTATEWIVMLYGVEGRGDTFNDAMNDLQNRLANFGHQLDKREHKVYKEQLDAEAAEVASDLENKEEVNEETT